MRGVLMTLLSAAVAGGLVVALGVEPRGLWLVGIALSHVAVLAIGVVSLRSGILCRAVWRAPRSVAAVALTYDDGPDPRSTPALLDLLRERGVAATFFCVGARLRAAPELAMRCHAEGHLLANHSDGHAPWTNLLFTGRMTREVAACQTELQRLTGERPRFYRPPFGLANHALAAVARTLELTVVGWQARGRDLRGSDPDRVARRVLRRIRPGGIVLLHDGGREPGLVVAATARILDGLAARGLRAVRLDRLLADEPAPEDSVRRRP